MTKMLQVVICFSLIVQLSGCGTLLHPERRGQNSGRLDAGIVALDGIGLLFFLVPGLIAFAVDFTTGAIYLPGTGSRLSDQKNLKVARFDPKNASIASIEEILREETGHSVKLFQEDTRVTRLESLSEMKMQFADVLPIKSNNPHRAEYAINDSGGTWKKAE